MITLREYLEILNYFAEKRPEALDLQVVFSSDPDGSNYYPVDGIPIIGNYCEAHADFISKNKLKEEESEAELNAVRIN